MFYLQNLCSSEIRDDVKPWEFTDFQSVPEVCIKNKEARDGWINNKSTQFHCYSLYEGTSRFQRLRSDKAGEEGEGNPPLLMHGLAVDYDQPLPLEVVQQLLPAMGELVPQWFEQTLSGNARLVWVFEKPLRFPSRSFLIDFLTRIHELLPIDKVPGRDRPALTCPERYFTNGCRWTALNPQPVSEAILLGFFLEFSEKFNWRQREFGKAIDLEAVASECRKKFPRFAEWPGEFVVGAQGPSFWIDGSLSPKSAIVRDTGMQTFALHASKAFYPWADLVGAQFVDNREHEKLGAAVADIYYDGKSYFYKDASGRFVADSEKNVRLILQLGRGLSPHGRKGEASPVDKAMHYIITQSRVENAGPWVFYPKGLITVAGKQILNTHNTDAMVPAAESTPWGDAGKFPNLSKFFGGFFNPQEIQLDRFLAWLQSFYRACLNREPRSGHAVILCGPVGIGKTLLSGGVISRMVGGCADASQYFTNQDNFNSELFDCALWTVDDGSIITGKYSHQLFTEKMKRMVANGEQRVNEKFRKAACTDWRAGRVMLSFNVDPESIRAMPRLDISIMDKLMIFAVQASGWIFPEQNELRRILDQELPYFCRWILDWQPPAHCFAGAEARFGVAAYAEPGLVMVSNYSSPVHAVLEPLMIWLTDFFRDDPTAQSWRGSATELRLAMMRQNVELLRNLKSDALARALVQLQQREDLLQISHIDTPAGRVFTITRNGLFSGRKTDIKQTLNPRFQNDENLSS